MVPDAFIYDFKHFNVRIKFFFRFRSNIWYTNNTDILELISMGDIFPFRLGDLFSSKVYGISSSWGTISNDWVKFYG